MADGLAGLSLAEPFFHLSDEIQALHDLLDRRIRRELLDVGVYEDLLDEVALLRDIHVAEEQVEQGKVVAHSVAARRLKARLLK